MPPQPLRKKYSFFDLERSTFALAKRPQLALAVACICSVWGSVERGLEMLLLTMLGVDSTVGHAMYKALTGSAAQRSAFDAVAAVKLTADEQEALAEVWQEFKVCGGMRNDIAHGIWASHDDFPDALILLDMDGHLDALAAWEANAKTDDNAREALNAGKHMLYKAKDFAEIQHRMHELINAMFMLSLLIRNRVPIKSADNQPGDG